jgi:hypothetical protein
LDIAAESNSNHEGIIILEKDSVDEDNVYSDSDDDDDAARFQMVYNHTKILEKRGADGKTKVDNTVSVAEAEKTSRGAIHQFLRIILNSES